MQRNDEQINELATGTTNALREPMRQTYNDRYIIPFLPLLVGTGRYRDTSTRSAGRHGRSDSRGYTNAERPPALVCALTLPWMSVCFFPATNGFAGSATFPALPSSSITTSSKKPVRRSASPATTSKTVSVTNAGWCPRCETATMVSALVLVGLFPFTPAAEL
jgi:hypothetical protein